MKIIANPGDTFNFLKTNKQKEQQIVHARIYESRSQKVNQLPKSTTMY